MNDRRRLGIAMVGWWVMIVLWLLCMFGHAHASEHMRIEPCISVRDYHQCARITIAGRIFPPDLPEFIERTKDIQKAIIILSGPGGAERASINIGEIIHAKGFSTYVPSGSECVSGCAYMWLAGRTKEMGIQSTLAWHAAFSGNDQHADGNGSALLGMYLAHLGYGYDDVDKLIGYDPNDMYAMIKDANGLQTEKNFRTP